MARIVARRDQSTPSALREVVDQRPGTVQDALPGFKHGIRFDALPVVPHDAPLCPHDRTSHPLTRTLRVVAPRCGAPLPPRARHSHSFSHSFSSGPSTFARTPRPAATRTAVLAPPTPETETPGEMRDHTFPDPNTTTGVTNHPRHQRRDHASIAIGLFGKEAEHVPDTEGSEAWIGELWRHLDRGKRSIGIAVEQAGGSTKRAVAELVRRSKMRGIRGARPRHDVVAQFLVRAEIDHRIEDRCSQIHRIVVVRHDAQRVRERREERFPHRPQPQLPVGLEIVTRLNDRYVICRHARPRVPELRTVAYRAATPCPKAANRMPHGHAQPVLTSRVLTSRVLTLRVLTLHCHARPTPDRGFGSNLRSATYPSLATFHFVCSARYFASWPPRSVHL